MTKCCIGPLGLYEKIVPPRRLYTSEEIQDTLPFMTKDNWTLESVCCKGKNKKRAIFAATGPSALRSSQTLTAVICSFIGGIMMLLVVVGCVMWVNVGSMAVWLVVPAVILSIMCCLLPMATSSYRTYKKHSEVRRDVKKSLAKDIDGGEEGNTKERKIKLRSTAARKASRSKNPKHAQRSPLMWKSPSPGRLSQAESASSRSGRGD